MYILFPSLSWLIDILFQCTFGCFSYLNSDVSAFILRNGLPDHVAAQFLTLKVTSLLVCVMTVTSYIPPVKKKKKSPLFKPNTSISCREGNGTPLQYSCLENPMDGGAWKAAVHVVAESDTTERLHFHFSLSCIGEGNGNPLQCSCLENPRDGGALWAAVYRVAQSRTRLKRLSSSSISWM